jgi:hypothetical protein
MGENKDDLSCTFLRYSLAEPQQERTIKCKRGKGKNAEKKHVSGRERGERERERRGGGGWWDEGGFEGKEGGGGSI